ncbi:hypothetical protein, partial [Klebsiella pneumoniae]|uniref:hypothetical protein n=1 Tax=Klebsiella pneumoniae TaxID=573 RepID=UPI001330ADBD
YVEEIIKSDRYALQAGDTLDSIRQMVADRYKLIGTELEWDLPTLDIAPGETKVYTLRAVEGSKVYLGGLPISISNNQAA